MARWTLMVTFLAAAATTATLLGADGAEPVKPTSESLFPSSTLPQTAAVSDPGAVELGVRFEVTVPGTITGVRYYDGAAASSETHVGSLWSGTGERLATATFAEGMGRGWREADFASGVHVDPDTIYVASYFAPQGGYADDEDGFRTAITRGDLEAPANAGVYTYGAAGGFPTDTWRSSNYLVDVVFVADTGATASSRSTPPPTTPPATISSSRTTPSATTPQTAPSTVPRSKALLNLPRVRWYGGPAYYARFSKAAASGWTSPRHFPVAVFLGKPSHARRLAALGINTYMGAEHDGSPISRVTRAGISVLAQDEWTTAEIGSNPRVVGYDVSDECEMGNNDCGDDEGQRLASQQRFVDARRSLHDGRFIQANFGNGVLGTWWAPTTMAEHVALMDVTSVDKYAYTSPAVDGLFSDSPFWPKTKRPASSGTYGWLEDRMEAYASPVASKPNWVIVETARPLLTEAGARTIQPDQIEGAVWNALIHGAAGITYFQHNNNGQCGTYSILECSRALRNKVKSIDAQIAQLASVLNTESYAWRFGRGIDTMLKAKAGHAYIFAMTRGGTGSRTFRLPPGVTGPIQVIGEHRSIPVSHRRFTDSFRYEYTHHIYRAALR